MGLAPAPLVLTFMFSDIPGAGLLALCLALLPGFEVWWKGRALARTPDDPLLPERLLTSRLRSRHVLAFTWVVLLTGWWDRFYPLMALMLVARALGGYPLRRALNGESWPPLAYLWFFIRLIAAVFGFWLLLVWLPELALAAGRAASATAIVIAAILALWHWRSAAVIRALLRSQPMTDPDLDDRFRRLLARAGLPPPRFEVVPIGGGVFANAVALPSSRTPAVLFSSTLIERFDVDEIEGVCAHELAHIEQYNPARLRRLDASVALLIATAVALVPAARAFAGDTYAWLQLLWMAVVVGYLICRARSRQKDETAADLRAVEWTGKPEALVSALVKLHAIGRVPRRWESQFERHASHPSLARRIQAIRGACGQQGAAPGIAATFVSTPCTITFQSDHMHWSEGDLAMHRLAYSRLTELRLDVRSVVPRLIAVEQGGRRWELPVEGRDASEIQRVLDMVDVRLAQTAPAPAFPAAVVRLACGVVGLLALSATQLAAALPAVLAFIQPSRTMCIAAAAGTIAGAIVAARSAVALGSAGFYLWSSVLLGVAGALMVALAWASRHDTETPATKPLLVLAASTGLAWTALLASGGSAVHLYRMAQGSAAAVILPCALGAGLAASRRAQWRRAGALVGLAALVVFALGTRTYVESFSSDLFVAPARTLPVAAFAGRQISETRLPSEASWLRLSPSGRSIAFAADDDEDEPRAFQVGRCEGPYHRIVADDLFFIDDDDVLVLENRNRSTAMRRVRVEAGGSENTAVWERHVDGSMSASFDPRSGAWRLLGVSGDEIVQVSGNADGAALGERRWPLAEGRTGGWIEPVAVSAETVLVLERKYDSLALPGRIVRQYMAPFVYLLTSDSGFETRVSLVGRGGRRAIGTSAVNPQCRAVGDGEPICLAFDGTRSTIYRVDAGRANVVALTSVVGNLHSLSAQTPEWLTATWSTRHIAIRADGREGWMFPQHGSEWIGAAAVTGRLAAVSAVHDRDWNLKIYERAAPVASPPAGSAQSRR